MFEDKSSPMMERASGVRGGTLAGSSLRPMTRREMLLREINEIEEVLNNKRAALQALDDNPNLEQFIDILQKAGM